MSQNAGRQPIIDDATRSYSIACNPYGDEPEHAGFHVSCFDPVTGEHSLVGELHPTEEEARAFLELILAD